MTEPIDTNKIRDGVTAAGKGDAIACSVVVGYLYKNAISIADEIDTLRQQLDIERKTGNGLVDRLSEIDKLLANCESVPNYRIEADGSRNYYSRPHHLRLVLDEIDSLRRQLVDANKRIAELEVLLNADPSEVVPLKPKRHYQIQAQVVREGD